MWNAYTTSTVALPGRDVRFEDVTIDGSLNFSNYDTFTATVTHEDGVTTTSNTFKVLQIGDIVHLYIPQLDITLATYTRAYKSFTLPAAFRPATSQLSQPLQTNEGGNPTIGSCFFNSTSEIRLYTRSNKANPTNTYAATINDSMFSYFKSL